MVPAIAASQSGGKYLGAGPLSDRRLVSVRALVHAISSLSPLGGRQSYRCRQVQSSIECALTICRWGEVWESTQLEFAIPIHYSGSWEALLCGLVIAHQNARKSAREVRASFRREACATGV